MNEIVSVIITIHNGEKFIDNCLQSIINQTVFVADNRKTTAVELCIFDDASTDGTINLLEQWSERCRACQIDLKIAQNSSGVPLGVGYGRNRSVEQSRGHFLCFQDIDDEMFPDRIENQLSIAAGNLNAIVGSKFVRTPPNATCRFTSWANNINESKLMTQIFTSHGPTIIMPTWFCHRQVFDRIGGFSEAGKGTPEDLLFFYKHLDAGGTVLRSNHILLNYKYHPEATTFTVNEQTIWNIRLERLLSTVLNQLPWTKSFSIWNAGKQGRKFFRCLPEFIRNRVIAFCDVDESKYQTIKRENNLIDWAKIYGTQSHKLVVIVCHPKKILTQLNQDPFSRSKIKTSCAVVDKINKTYNYFDEVKRKICRTIPIVHFTKVHPPIIICMKLDLTKGGFETNLQSLNLIEGVDYVLFS